MTIESLEARLLADAKSLIAGKFKEYTHGKECIVRSQRHPIPTDENPDPVQTMVTVIFEFPDWFPGTRNPRACSCFAMDINEPEANSRYTPDIIKMRILDALEDMTHLRQEATA